MSSDGKVVNLLRPGVSLSKQGLLGATGLLIAANAGSKLMGFAREVLTARAYGVSAQVDAFLVSLSVPDLVGSALGAALAAALIPQLTRLGSEQGEAQTYARRVLSVSFSAAIALLGLTFFGARWIVNVVAPGLPPTISPLAVSITRILSLVTASLFLDRVLTGIFQGFHHFVWPAASVLLFNACSIVFLVIFAPSRGIWALVDGWTLGVILAMIVQAIFLFRFLGAPILRGLPASDLRWLGRTGLEIFFLTSVPGLLYVIARAVAARLQEGSVATLGYSQRLFQLPVEVVIMGVLLGAYPMLSKLSNQKSSGKLAASADELCRTIMLLSTLVTALMVVLSHDLVELAFQRGAFDARATAVTARVLFCMAPALPGLATAMLVMRVFMSCGQTRQAFSPVLLALLLDGGLSWLLAPRFGTPGIAAAFSLTWTILAVQMTFALHRHVPEFRPFPFLFSAGRTCLTAALTCAVMIFVYDKTGILHLFLAGVATAVFFLGFVLLFEPEQRSIVQKLGRRFGELTRQFAPQFEASSS
jgi:putative peptidoglycan lipid II flippase